MKTKLEISNLDPSGVFIKMLPVHIRKFYLYNDRARFKRHKWKFPYYQRGSVSAFAYGTMAAAGGGGGGSVVLTNGSSSHENIGNECYAGWQFQPDGTLDDVGPLVTNLTLKTSGEWWSDEPETGIGASYQVRTTSASGWNSSAAANTVWTTDISTNKSWYVLVLGKFSPDIASATGVFEIREKDVGSALDSATLSALAEN